MHRKKLKRHGEAEVDARTDTDDSQIKCSSRHRYVIIMNVQNHALFDHVPPQHTTSSRLNSKSAVHTDAYAEKVTTL